MIRDTIETGSHIYLSSPSDDWWLQLPLHYNTRSDRIGQLFYLGKYHGLY